jgi:molecular chaperone GrpE (heat shock protein)
MIQDEKQFAIGKFAVDLLEVRDAIKMAQDNFDLEKM